LSPICPLLFLGVSGVLSSDACTTQVYMGIYNVSIYGQNVDAHVSIYICKNLHTYVDTTVRMYIHGENREVGKGGNENREGRVHTHTFRHYMYKDIGTAIHERTHTHTTHSLSLTHTHKHTHTHTQTHTPGHSSYGRRAHTQL
jgi:hypothetical protein